MSSKGFDTTSSGSNKLDSYYNSACGSNGAGFLMAEGTTSASETTGWPDNGYVVYASSSAFFPMVGGYYGCGANAGLFYARVYGYSTTSRSDACARLSFRG